MAAAKGMARVRGALRSVSSWFEGGLEQDDVGPVGNEGLVEGALYDEADLAALQGALMEKLIGLLESARTWADAHPQAVSASLAAIKGPATRPIPPAAPHGSSVEALELIRLMFECMGRYVRAWFRVLSPMQQCRWLLLVPQDARSPIPLPAMPDLPLLLTLLAGDCPVAHGYLGNEPVQVSLCYAHLID